jgi:pyruvate,water dikinase
MRPSSGYGATSCGAGRRNLPARSRLPDPPAGRGITRYAAAVALPTDRRDEREDAFEKRPPSWLGTATEEALAFPYAGLWGFPDRFHAGEPSTTGEIKGLAASPGVVEGTARYVASLEEFDKVQDGDILVCRMTNPAWVVLFTKIKGLVTEAGGATSHPAVVAREFGIPAVVGTGNAGERIKTGDRVRVNGATGIVEVLG